MTRRTVGRIEYDALSIEGAILPAEWLGKVAALEAPAQSPSDYGVPRGLQLRDEISRYWKIAAAAWSEFTTARAASAATAGNTDRFVEQLLAQAFGFVDLEPGVPHEVGGRTFTATFSAVAKRVPVFVASHDESLDHNADRHGDGTRRRSAWGALQEYLNAFDGSLWGLAINGLTLRLGRDNASLTRPAWLEADLERLFTEERFADFSVLWLVLHASRFGRPGGALADCPLERWREAAQSQGSRARDSLRDGVERTLLELGQGFIEHPANETLRTAIASGELSRDAYFAELLRLVYRMIFLLTVEERGLLHKLETSADAESLYRDGYGVRRLRERSLRRSAHDRHTDLWTSLRPVFGGLGSSAGEPALGLPGLGGLFSADQCPHLDRSTISNSRFLAAVFHLAWMQGPSLVRVNWKDMGVEEFGSVYESLLELVPLVSTDAREFRFGGADVGAGNVRKTTGSYYTPDSLVQQLLDTALEPVVAARVAAVDGRNKREVEHALLSITVVDPACGSGHFLLAAARRLAGHLARARSGGTPGASEYRLALRDVVTHCIHGVDRNPMALELARMALWLEAYTPERALGFIDHHLLCGDALLGVMRLDALKAGVPAAALKRLSGDDPDIVRELSKLNRQALRALEGEEAREQLALRLETGGIATRFAALESVADDRVTDADAKRAQYAALSAEVHANRVSVAADALVAAFLLPKRPDLGEPALTAQQVRDRFPTTATVALALDGVLSADSRVARDSREACRRARVFHWPLAFPQVFTGGGFDIVLGNPPWERLTLKEQEYFAARAPHVAAARNAAARGRAIAALAEAILGTAERTLYDDFVSAKRTAEAASAWCHTEARFPLTGNGDVNTYALFAETMYQLCRRDGRVGVVIPTGIATDDSTKRFFSEVIAGRLVSLIDFRTGPGLFADIGHQRYKFCLLTLGQAAEAEFAFFLTDTDQLHDRSRRYHLSAADISLVNPNTLTAPAFRTEYDAELTKKIYRRVPVLIDESKSEDEGNAWGVSFFRMFDMSGDSELFLDSARSDALPLYEAKMIHQFDHRWATYERAARGQEAESRDVTPDEKANPALMVEPRYWLPRTEIDARLAAKGWTRNWLMGWRDICRSTDERTVIASVLPRTATGHTLLLMLPTFPDARAVAVLLGEQSALVHDYVARQKIGGTHLTYHTKKQVTNLPPSGYSADDIEALSAIVLELTYTSLDLKPWAADLGYIGAPFAWDEQRRTLLRAELDARFAYLYGLNREELQYVLDPSDLLGPQFPSETFRVLKTNEMRRFGEYRTRRLVLDAWDRLFGR